MGRLSRLSRLARPKRFRFLAWYRFVPLACIAVLGVVSAVYAYAPSLLLRPLYPIEYREEITQSSERHHVDPYLVAAVISVESGWDESAESGKGAVGLMQIMPETARDVLRRRLVDGEAFPADELAEPEVNIEIGCAYLAYLLDYFDGNVDRAVAAYNGGMGNVDEWVVEGGVLHNAITYPETQAYLVRVNNAQARYQDLYGDVF